MIQKFNNFKSVNESMHPHFNLLGYYDLSNTITDDIIDILKIENIDYLYESNSNSLLIENNNPELIYNLIEEFNLPKLDIGYDHSNDCLLLRLPRINTPKGSYL